MTTESKAATEHGAGGEAAGHGGGHGTRAIVAALLANIGIATMKL
jgi:hypothetical protein